MGGFGLSMFNALFYIAAHSTTAVNLGIMQSTLPGMILLGSFLIFGTRVNKLQITGLSLTFIGVVVMVSKGSMENLILLTFNNGDFLMLFGCLFYAAYTIGLKNRPKVSGMVMLGYFSICLQMLKTLKQRCKLKLGLHCVCWLLIFQNGFEFLNSIS